MPLTGLYCVKRSVARTHQKTHLINGGMDINKVITEIETLERIFSLPDPRPFGLSDRVAANQEHDEKLADNPWFRLWKRYGK
jgi:hypothetical protein